MNRQNPSAPRVAVLGPGLDPCARTPGFEVEVIADGQADPAHHARSYDLVHAGGDAPRGTAALYGRDGRRTFLSPSRAGDAALAALGVTQAAIRRWRPGVDRERFTPAAYCPDAIPQPADGRLERINLLHVGPLSADRGLRLLTDAFAAAYDSSPQIHLLAVGTGPEEETLRRRLGSAVSCLGALAPDRLAQVYATADLLVFADPGDLLAQPIVEAQASGLPVLAIDAGGAPELIESGRSGCLVQPSTVALAEAIGGLARRQTLRERLVTGALMGIGEHTWERALERLAPVWWGALAPADAHAAAEVEVARAA